MDKIKRKGMILMKYIWTEKGTRFNGKDYEFSIENHYYYNAVLCTCKYGKYSTDCVVFPDQELYWNVILDEMKDFLYRKNYI